jgi:hypothetical protein
MLISCLMSVCLQGLSKIFTCIINFDSYLTACMQEARNRQQQAAEGFEAPPLPALPAPRMQSPQAQSSATAVAPQARFLEAGHGCIRHQHWKLRDRQPAL